MVTEERHTGTRARLSAGGHTLSSAAANTFQPAVGTADAVSPRLAPALSGSLAPPGKGGPREAWECLASRSLIIVARPRLIERGPPHAAPSGNLREPRRGPPAGCPRRPALRRPPGQRVCRPSGAASSALNHSCCSTATSAAYQHRPAPSQPSGRRTSSPPPFPSALRHTLPHAMSLDRHVVDRSDESAPLLLPARRGLRVQCESRACGRRKGDEDGRTFPRMGQRTHVRKDGAKVHWLIRWPA